MTVSRIVREARSLRNRGFFLDAEALFDESLAEPSGDFNLLLGLEAASMNMTQGLTGRCQDRILEMQSRLDRERLDDESLALFDLFCAMSTAVTTAKLEEPLRCAVGVYHKMLHDRPEAEYDNSMVAAAASYHCLLAYARILGYQPNFDLPSFPVAFQSSLSLHLLSEKRFDDAFKIATLSNFSQESFDNRELLNSILADEQLPNLLRAETLWYHGDKLRQTAGGDEWKEELVEAARLFNAADHATGALQIRVDILKHQRGEDRTAQDTEELWRIKERVQSVGNWRGALECLAAIVRINTHALATPSAALLSRVQGEWIQLLQRCQSSELRTSTAMLEALEWQSTTCTSARDLEYLEHFYESIADFDAPSIIFYVIKKLYYLYSRIGDTHTAAACLARRPALVPRELFVQAGLDPFDQWLEARAVPPADADEEFNLLLAELEKVRGIILRTADIEGRVIEVQRLRDIASKYIGECRSRGREATELATDIIFCAIDEACDTLDSRQAAFWRAETLLCKAELCTVMTSYVSVVEDALRILSAAANHQRQAIEAFTNVGHPLNIGMAKAMLGMTHRTMWLVVDIGSESGDFEKATDYLAEATVAVERYGAFDLHRNYCHILVRTWYEKFCEEDDRPTNATIDPTTTRAYLSTVKWINKTERLARNQRNDLSVLARQPAVLYMQLLQGDNIMRSIYRKTFYLFNRTNNDLGIWELIQKQKARSLGTMLALGVNLPQGLQRRVDADTELVGMLNEERILTKATEVSSSPDEKWHSRNTLQAHRDAMRDRPVLGEILDIREGQPVLLTRLTEISGRASPDSTRKIVCVDWILVGNTFWAFVASDSGLRRFEIELDITGIHEWKSRWAEHLKQTPGSERELQERLEELSGFVQELLQYTHKGDILVFCPTDAMRGVPLHAAIVTENQAQCSLIERNPVVYTASMTSFAHCVAREADRGSVDRDVSRAYVSVFERIDDEGRPLTSEQKKNRDKLYKIVREAAENQQASSVHGSEATAERLVSALQADCMHFIGHCHLPSSDGSELPSVLHQGIEVANGTGSVENPDVRVFTTSDLFTVDILASNVVLLACASAKETNLVPNEPFGFISGLLCAGATSVVGTLWKIDLNTAKDTIEYLAPRIKIKEGNNVIDLAVAVQEVVLELKEDPGTSVKYWGPLTLHGSWFMSPRVKISPE